MSGRIETFGTIKEPTSKWSKNTTFAGRKAGVDIGEDSQGEGSVIDDTTSSATTTYSSAKIEELIASIPSGGGRSFTNVTYNPMTNNGINTIVTVEKEED